jgi:dihydrofolate reductase
MRISIIAAVAEGGVIGQEGGLPWQLPADLRHFRRLTMGHHLILGRRTWESVGRALPGRRILVVSRRDLELPAGVGRAPSLETALATARASGEEEVFIGGGAEIYRQALPLTDRLYFTRINAQFPGDTFFPAYDPSRWRLVHREEREPDAANAYRHSFEEYERAAAPVDERAG